MITSLKQPYPGEAALACAIHRGLHQQAADFAILVPRFDRDRPDRRNWIALIQEIATHNAAVDLGNNVEKSFVTDHIAKKTSGNFRSGKIWRKIVCLRNFLKCAIANRTGRSGIRLPAFS